MGGGGGGVHEERIIDMWGVKPTSMMDKNKFHCVVPENIQTLTMKGIGNSGGVRGSVAQEILKGGRPSSLPDVQEMIFCEFRIGSKGVT